MLKFKKKINIFVQARTLNMTRHANIRALKRLTWKYKTYNKSSNYIQIQGRSQDFSKGGGDHTGSKNIVMAFSPRYIV